MPNGNEFRTVERQEVWEQLRGLFVFFLSTIVCGCSLKDQRVIGRVCVWNRIAVAVRCVPCCVLWRGCVAAFIRERGHVLANTDFFRFVSLRRLSFFQHVFEVVTVRSLLLIAERTLI